MAYLLNFTKQAVEDIEFFKRSGNKAVLKKLKVLLEELSEHPLEGTGKPEQLKYDLSGCWSRRINQEHRLVYEIIDKAVFILSAKGHYV